MTKLSIVHRHSDQNNKELTPKGVTKRINKTRVQCGKIFKQK